MSRVSQMQHLFYEVKVKEDVYWNLQYSNISSGKVLEIKDDIKETVEKLLSHIEECMIRDNFTIGQSKGLSIGQSKGLSSSDKKKYNIYIQTKLSADPVFLELTKDYKRLNQKLHDQIEVEELDNNEVY